MKPQTTDRASSGFNVHDALYIVFKHKWKIILLTLVGFAVAGVMARQVLGDPSYESSAKLMVRYVVERATVDPEADDRMMSGGMLAEMEILKSRDTAIEVAEVIGPEKLIPDSPTPPTATDAAGIIEAGLNVVAPGGKGKSMSNMLFLSFRNSDYDLTSQVLAAVIQIYFKRHLELHRSTEAFSQVARQADEAKGKLRSTEEEINQLKNKSGILTIEATMQEFESRKQGIRENQMSAEAQLAEQRAKVSALKKMQHQSVNSKGNQETSAADEDRVGSLQSKDEDIEAKRFRTLAFAEYNDLVRRVELLQQRRNELLIDRTPGDPMAVSLDRQITQAQKRAFDLLEKHPDFAGIATQGQPGPLLAAVLSLDDEMAIEAAFEAKLETIKSQSKGLETEVARISALGFQLQDLERRRQLEEEKYRYFQSSLEKARLDEALDPSKIPNISVVQTPSPPVKSVDGKGLKLILGIAFSGLAAGLALAFLIEMVIDRRVSRPADIQTRLQLPLMMSIPYLRSKQGMAKLDYPSAESGPELLGGGGSAVAPIIPGTGDLPAIQQDAEHFIAPFAGAIHDRIIFNFHVNNITHKPKLIGLTGLSEGAGVSTIAGGLAKSFSENGNRKVLLVDLNAPVREPSSQRHPAESLRRAMEVSKNQHFRQNSKNLYFASAPMRRDGNGSTSLAPITLHEIMPHLLASDFDYIIFDMPMVGPTSPTLTIAGFMDKVLLVLDGEKSTRENLSWAYRELERGKADVSCIFNKARSHAPRWVQGAL